MKNIATFLFVYLLSTNIHGQFSSIQWQKSIGGGMYEFSKEIEYTSDGGTINIGYTESSDGDVIFNHGGGDCWIVKLNASGAIDWKKTYGGTGFDYGYSIKQTPDGGYIAAGYTESHDGDVTINKGGGDCWIIKLDNSGTIIWQKTFGGTLNDNGQSIALTADGGYIVTGYTESNNGDVTWNYGAGDCWVLKLDNSGSIQWQKSLGGSSYDFGQDIKQTSDGGFILSIGSNSNDGDVLTQHGNGDCWIVKLDNSGSIQWQKSFGGSNYDFGQSIEQTIDGGFILAGYSESNDGDVTAQHGNGDCWVVKCDKFGNLQWQKALGSSGNDYAYSIKQIDNGGYVLTGYSGLNDGDVIGNHGDYDCWVIELDNMGIVRMQKSFGGTGTDIGYSIRQTSPDSYIIAGYSTSSDGDVIGNHGGGDCWILRLNVSTLSIADYSQEQTITVAPNPSSGNFNFSGLQDESNLVIYDITGKIILQSEVKGINYSLNLKDEEKGIYFYSVTKKDGTNKTGKIILN
ncbi:MAG: T9SS type A sorting domain-containing protein [Bacteroidetes bacterium]|nr:T9SS type A sorting domain-containing protein [Bacteroidota bacterium]